MSGLGPDVVRHALTVARDLGCRTVRLRHGGESLLVDLGEAYVEPEVAEEPSTPAPPPVVELRATSVGYVRLLPGKLEPGVVIRRGDVVAEVVTLGIAGDLAASHGGTVEEVLVADGDPVEFDQPIARLQGAA